MSKVGERGDVLAPERPPRVPSVSVVAVTVTLDREIAADPEAYAHVHSSVGRLRRFGGCKQGQDAHAQKFFHMALALKVRVLRPHHGELLGALKPSMPDAGRRARFWTVTNAEKSEQAALSMAATALFTKWAGFAQVPALTPQATLMQPLRLAVRLRKNGKSVRLLLRCPGTLDPGVMPNRSASSNSS
jgi:hypothetical protein